MSYVKIGDFLISSADKRIMLTSVSDSGSGNVARKETSFPGYDGNEISDITYTSRAIMVHGTLFGDSVEDVEELKMKLRYACNPLEKTEIYYHNGAKEYYAEAYPSSLPTFSKLNNHTYQFIVYLDLNAFWWLSPSEIRKGVFVREDNIKGQLSFPQAFTVRHQGAEIYNNGAVATPLEIDISVLSDFKESLIIRNTTYDLSVVIEDYSFTSGEIISLNMGVNDEYTIKSSLNGNIVKYLTEDSEFFRLEKGYNLIECGNDTALALSIVLRYRERFPGV